MHHPSFGETCASSVGLGDQLLSNSESITARFAGRFVSHGWICVPRVAFLLLRNVCALGFGYELANLKWKKIIARIVSRNVWVPWLAVESSDSNAK